MINEATDIAIAKATEATSIRFWAYRWGRAEDGAKSITDKDLAMALSSTKAIETYELLHGNPVPHDMNERLRQLLSLHKQCLRWHDGLESERIEAMIFKTLVDAQFFDKLQVSFSGLVFPYKKAAE